MVYTLVALIGVFMERICNYSPSGSILLDDHDDDEEGENCGE